MKKSLLLVFVIMLSFCCTGCIKSSYNIEIDDKDNVSVSKTMAMNLSFFESYDPNFDDKFKDSILESEDEFEKDGYEVEEYSDGTYRGVSLSKKGIRFEDASEVFKNDFVDEDKLFSLEKKGLSKIYKIHLFYDPKKAMVQMSEGKTDEFSMNNSEDDSLIINGEADEVVSKTKETDPNTGDVTETTHYASGAVSTTKYNPQQQEQFGNAIGNYLNSVPGLKPVFEMTIKIPEKAIKHNATKVISDTEYYWDFSNSNGIAEVVLEYKKFDFSSLGPIFSVLIIAVIMGAAFVMFKNDGN